MTAYTTDEIVAGIAHAMADYAQGLPETSQDAPFIYSHRQELARAALAKALEMMQEPTIEMELAATPCASGGVHPDDGNPIWRAMIQARREELG